MIDILDSRKLKVARCEVRAGAGVRPPGAPLFYELAELVPGVARPTCRLEAGAPVGGGDKNGGRARRWASEAMRLHEALLDQKSTSVRPPGGTSQPQRHALRGGILCREGNWMVRICPPPPAAAGKCEEIFLDVTPGSLGPCRTGHQRGNPGLMSFAPSGQASWRSATGDGWLLDKTARWGLAVRAGRTWQPATKQAAIIANGQWRQIPNLNSEISSNDQQA